MSNELGGMRPADEVAQALARVLVDHGWSAVGNSARLRAMLNDVLGVYAAENRSAVDALVIAAEETIPTQLEGMDVAQRPSGQVDLSNSLSAWGLDPSTSTWAVGTWAWAIDSVMTLPATAPGATAMPIAAMGTPDETNLPPEAITAGLTPVVPVPVYSTPPSFPFFSDSAIYSDSSASAVPATELAAGAAVAPVVIRRRGLGRGGRIAVAAGVVALLSITGGTAWAMTRSDSSAHHPAAAASHAASAAPAASSSPAPSPSPAPTTAPTAVPVVTPAATAAPAAAAPPAAAAAPAATKAPVTTTKKAAPAATAAPAAAAAPPPAAATPAPTAAPVAPPAPVANFTTTSYVPTWNPSTASFVPVSVVPYASGTYDTLTVEAIYYTSGYGASGWAANGKINWQPNYNGRFTIYIHWHVTNTKWNLSSNTAMLTISVLCNTAYASTCT